MSRQDNANPEFWLATRVGKMGPSCQLGISHVGPVRKVLLFGHVINPLLNDKLRACLVKMAVYCAFAFLCFYWLGLEMLQRTWLCISQFHLHSAPTHPPPPRATAGLLPTLSVLGVGHLQILHCPGAGHLPTPGPFPSFWHARGFLSEYNYTEGFTGKKQIGSSVKDRNKL